MHELMHCLTEGIIEDMKKANYKALVKKNHKMQPCLHLDLKNFRYKFAWAVYCKLVKVGIAT